MVSAHNQKHTDCTYVCLGPADGARIEPCHHRLPLAPGARRTQADRSAATRDALVAAARRLFAAHGFAEVPTDSIATAAGVTRGALYHQFADKMALFEAALDAVEADIAARLAA